MLRPAVPNCPASRVGSSRTNALALSQALTEWGPLLGLPTRSGRCAEKPVISGALPWAATSLESNTVNGVPVISVTIPLSCHPPRACLYHSCPFSTLVVPPKHTLAKKREVDVAALGKENFI